VYNLHHVHHDKDPQWHAMPRGSLPVSESSPLIAALSFLLSALIKLELLDLGLVAVLQHY